MKYHLLNRSKQTVLAREVELADTSWTRMRGLLGLKADQFTSGKGLWIVPSQGVHTVGMSFSIDVFIWIPNGVSSTCVTSWRRSESQH